MEENKKSRSFFKAVGRYFSFFLLVAFVITCCLMLFVTVLSDDLGIELTNENIAAAAKITFWNVILISLIFTIIDTVRRKCTVERPARLISEAARKMVHGDFNIRIPTVSRLLADDTFNDIIRCINKMAEELSGVETLRADFIANVSHEMKTPLAVIQNYCMLLQSSELTEVQRIEYAKGLNIASKRLSDMITNILKLNKLENQQIYHKTECYDLSEQICECILQYENIWERKGVEIDTDIEENITVSADRELLELVWNNLLSNAFKLSLCMDRYLL